MKSLAAQFRRLACVGMFGSLLVAMLAGCGQKGDLYLPSADGVDARQQPPKAVEKEALKDATGVIIDTGGARKAGDESAESDKRTTE